MNLPSIGRMVINASRNEGRMERRAEVEAGMERRAGMQAGVESRARVQASDTKTFKQRCIGSKGGRQKRARVQKQGSVPQRVATRCSLSLCVS